MGFGTPWPPKTSDRALDFKHCSKNPKTPEPPAPHPQPFNPLRPEPSQSQTSPPGALACCQEFNGPHRMEHLALQRRLGLRISSAQRVRAFRDAEVLGVLLAKFRRKSWGGLWLLLKR